MPLNASRFIKKPSRKLAITNRRIGHIIWYIVECYLLLQKDNPKYSKSQINSETAYKLEDFYKMELVDGYLIRHKKLLQDKVSTLEHINFAYETIKRFTDIDQKKKSDKIDVYINKLGLQKEWREQDENIYFAIECKRIKVLSDIKLYIDDIEKFTSRKHKDLRLPFEGMIAFIENKKLNHQSISNEVNKRLTNQILIKTTQYLTNSSFHKSFDGTYISKHQKNFSQKTFSIFHLMFDYSENVTI